MTIDELKQKSILVWGIGVSGQAVIELLDRYGISYSLMDQRPLGLDRKYPKANKIWAQDEFKAMSDSVDLIIKAPGIKLKPEQQMIIEGKKISLIGELELGTYFCHKPIIAITGSNGKTTVSTMVSEILKALGVHHFLGGNIGRPLCLAVDQLDVIDLMVLEVSSFQLEFFKDFDPEIAAILNLFPHHLEHHRDFADYIQAKANIIGPNTELVLNQQVLKQAAEYLIEIGDGKNLIHKLIDPVEKGKCTFKKLAGKHNESNWQFACQMVELANQRDYLGKWYTSDEICRAFESVRASFTGVEHRLEWVADIKGVQVYNDSKSTNLTATLTAVESFHDKKITLIIGGKKRHNVLNEFKQLNQLNQIETLVFIGEAGCELEQLLGGDRRSVRLGSIEAFQNYLQSNKDKLSSEVLLFSPGFPSFDWFDHFEQRGLFFKKCIQHS
jgi:UDP-N-acetylmuramoylalanine--D-glutamate ligase